MHTKYVTQLHLREIAATWAKKCNEKKYNNQKCLLSAFSPQNSKALPSV